MLGPIQLGGLYPLRAATALENSFIAVSGPFSQDLDLLLFDVTLEREKSHIHWTWLIQSVNEELARRFLYFNGGLEDLLEYISKNNTHYTTIVKNNCNSI